VAGPEQLTTEVKYRLLLQISEKLSGTLDLDSMLDHLIDAVQSAVPYDAAGIFILSHGQFPFSGAPVSSMIAGTALRGFDPQIPERDPMLRAGKGIVGYVIKTGECLIIPDTSRDPRYVAGREGTRSEIAVPIVIGGHVIGALNLESNHLCAFTDADLELLQFFANAAAISIEKGMLHQQLLEKKRIDSQLEVARDVQSSLLPKRPPLLAGYDIAGLNLPTWEVGGDYYDFIEFPNHHWGIAVADVSGKGVPSALIMATFRAALRTQVRIDYELAHIMQAMNRLLTESIGAAEFVTAVYGVLDPGSGRYTFANCGHNPPLLLRAGGSTEQLLTGGMALGVLPETHYEAAITTLSKGDTLVLFTDGVVEVADERGEEFEVHRLEKVVRENLHLSSADLIEAVVGATRTHSESSSYSDDFTLVIVKRL